MEQIPAAEAERIMTERCPTEICPHTYRPRLWKCVRTVPGTVKGPKWKRIFAGKKLGQQML
jgi:hypothetical protein